MRPEDCPRSFSGDWKSPAPQAGAPPRFKLAALALSERTTRAQQPKAPSPRDTRHASTEAVIGALTWLGFKKDDAARALAVAGGRIDVTSASTEMVLREALRVLA